MAHDIASITVLPKMAMLAICTVTCKIKEMNEADKTHEGELPPEYYELIRHREAIIPASALLIPKFQVRDRMNKDELAGLERSFGAMGILQQPTIEMISDADLLNDRLKFINEIWGGDDKAENYARTFEGMYPLVVAGHRRSIASQAYCEYVGSDRGVPCNVRYNLTPEEFIAIQIEENRSTNPRPERRAAGIVGIYRYGMQHDLWGDEVSFLARTKEIGKDILSDALHLNRLPREVQQVVFDGQLYYGAGVALGRQMSEIETYVKHRAGNDVSEEEYRGLLIYQLNNIVGNLVDKRLSKKGSLSRAESTIEEMIEQFKAEMDPMDEDQQTQLFIAEMTNAPARQADAYREELEREADGLLYAVSQRRGESALMLLDVASRLLNIDLTGKRNAIIQSNIALNRSMGDAASRKFWDERSGDNTNSV